MSVGNLLKRQLSQLIFFYTQFYALYKAKYYLGVISWGGEAYKEAVWTGLYNVIVWE